jgi:tight adherence protein C
MSSDQILAVGTFGAIALLVWLALSAYSEKQSSASDRLERLMKNTLGRRGTSGLLKKQAQLQSIVARAAPALSKPLRPKNAAELGKLRESLLNAGFRSENAVHIYLGVKFACLLLCLGLAVPSIYAAHGFDGTGIRDMGLVAGIGFYLPGVVLSQLKKRRQEAIFLGLPDALDLMVVCVEAGLGLDAAMRRVAVDLVDSCPVMCEELALSNFQVQMGRPRKEVLHDLGQRTGVDDLRSLAAVLIQAERFGASIATALRVQSDSMRVKRRQRAEEKAAKTAVLLILPLVLFIFPGIFVVLVGPAGIQIANTLMH